MQRRPVGDQRLLQYVLGVSQAACGSPGDQGERLLGGFDALRGAELGEAGDDRVHRYAPEVEALAPGYYRQRHLVHLRRREDEDGVGRRLLEGFEQGVERRLGQHVDLVHDVHLVARLVGREVDLLAQASNVVDSAVRRRVDLDQVQGASLVDRLADVALPVWLALQGRPAVDGLGEDPRRARLAGAARPAQQVGVGHPVLRHRVAERLRHRVLSGDLAQQARTPLSVEDLAHPSVTSIRALPSRAAS